MSSSGDLIQMRIKYADSSKVVRDVSKTGTTVRQLLSMAGVAEDVDLERVKILKGFPPKAVAIASDQDPLAAAGFENGESVSIEVIQGSTANAGAKRQKTTLARHTVPADNSCLFTSVNFCVSGRESAGAEEAAFMRDIIAAAVSSDKDRFSEAILGKANEDYCEWIRKSDTWGGAIEAQVLAEYLGIMVTVVDTQSDFTQNFGEGLSLGQRLFLIYDGIHYDPLYRDLPDKKQTLFEMEDEKALEEAKAVVAIARTARQFTDVNNFSLRCITCETPLKGQADARSHATKTGHTNFGEV